MEHLWDYINILFIFIIINCLILCYILTASAKRYIIFIIIQTFVMRQCHRMALPLQQEKSGESKTVISNSLRMQICLTISARIRTNQEGMMSSFSAPSQRLKKTGYLLRFSVL